MNQVNIDESSRAIEAILFVTGDSVALKDLETALEITDLETDQAVETLRSDLESKDRGIQLKRFGDRIQLTTRPDLAPYIEKMLQPVQRQSLSRSAMETLAIVAYKQPVTKLEVEAIRGVKCDYSIQSLVNKGLIAEVGRKDALGRPILYGTTENFLAHFGLERIEDLPLPPELKRDEDDEEEPLVP